jgi:hypothetical protein
VHLLLGEQLSDLIRLVHCGQQVVFVLSIERIDEAEVQHTREKIMLAFRHTADSADSLNLETFASAFTQLD